MFSGTTTRYCSILSLPLSRLYYLVAILSISFNIALQLF
uniref:Uncharacterized protein n=1 Tax=Podoviridae sp. ctxqo3 TaxID=2827755 RepID=A0A8S5SYY6_9CAUD|nr:MAG TPA: hypothetical protein [Podoviridae sp. ctxqo3]